MKLSYTVLAAAALMLICSGDPIIPNTPLAVDLDLRKGAVLEFESDGAKYYQFEYSPDLVNWDKEGYSFKGTGGHMAVPVSGRGQDRAFYRLRDDGDPKNILTANPSRTWISEKQNRAALTDYVNAAPYEINLYIEVGVANGGSNMWPGIITRKDSDSDWIAVARTVTLPELVYGHINAVIPAGWQYRLETDVPILYWNELK